MHSSPKEVTELCEFDEQGMQTCSPDKVRFATWLLLEIPLTLNYERTLKVQMPNRLHHRADASGTRELSFATVRIGEHDIERTTIQIGSEIRKRPGRVSFYFLRCTFIFVTCAVSI